MLAVGAGRGKSMQPRAPAVGGEEDLGHVACGVGGEVEQFERRGVWTGCADSGGGAVGGDVPGGCAGQRGSQGEDDQGSGSAAGGQGLQLPGVSGVRRGEQEQGAGSVFRRAVGARLPCCRRRCVLLVVCAGVGDQVVFCGSDSLREVGALGQGSELGGQCRQ
ncbi:hypothetical protein BIV25_05865 [Streptomyces sp. MUSC 14]|nr:hypothetical protein BIV25_05865 [Streptomyces sp. MUSC 14]